MNGAGHKALATEADYDDILDGQRLCEELEPDSGSTVRGENEKRDPPHVPPPPKNLKLEIPADRNQIHSFEIKFTHFKSN